MKKYTYNYEAIEQENESTYYAQTNEDCDLFVWLDDEKIYIGDHLGNKVEGYADYKIYDAYFYDLWLDNQPQEEYDYPDYIH